jgi:hypothetical protein
MCLGFSKLGLSLVLAAFAASSPLVNHALAQGKPQPRRSIELSETNSAEILTNLNQLTTKKDEFRQLDEQLRTLKGLSGLKSMEQGFSMPYAAPAARPNKRMKDLLERQKNWSLTPEDINLSTGSAGSEVSTFDETDKMGSKHSSLQQFYNALNRSTSDVPGRDGSANDKSASDKGSIFTQEKGTEDDSSLPPEIRAKTQRLKDVVNEDPSSIFNPARPRSNFENFFGTSANTSTPDQATARKTSIDTFLDQFKKGMDTSVAAGMDPTLSAIVPEAGSSRKTLSPELTKLPSTAHHEASEPTPAKVNSVLDVTSVSDMNGAVLNQWNPLYTPPKIQLPKVTPPTPPNLDFPRRKF